MQTQDNANFFIVMAKGWVEKDGKYLLARRGPKELHMPGIWSLPGGKVEQEIAEHIIEKTLTKEIEEEVGITVSPHMELVYNNSFQRTDGPTVIGFTFLCQYQSGTPEALEDTTEIAWHTLEQLQQLTGLEPFLVKEIEILSTYLQNKKR